MGIIAAFKEIFAFFFKQDLKAKRTKVFFAISMLPVVILAIAKILEIVNPDTQTPAEKVFSYGLSIVYIQLLIPVLALLYGALIVNEEVDNKTLVFLTTSPIPRPAIILGKYFASILVSALIVNIGFILCFIIINLNQLGDIQYAREFFNFLGTGTIELTVYTALFALMGTIFKKSIGLGLLVFGWENAVQYFPGVTQKLTIMHFVKSLLPQAEESQGFLKILTFQLEPTPVFEAVVVMLIITILTLSASCYIFNKKEYLLSDSV